MIYNNVLEAVGNTPMIRLNHMVKEGSAEVLVKYEGVNVGGPIKTRTALHMIEQAEQKGLELSYTRTTDMPEIYADESQLERAVTNIISNSIKYCTSGDSVKIFAGSLNFCYFFNR